MSPLLSNANLSGDNCHRGMLLGMLLGLVHGDQYAVLGQQENVPVSQLCEG